MYSREESIAKHREAGKYGATLLRTGRLRPTNNVVSAKPKKRQSRKTKRSAKRKLDTFSSEDEEMYVEEPTSDENDDDDDSEDEDEEHGATLRPTQEEQQTGEEINESGDEGPEDRRAAHEIDRIVEHGRASEMAAKFKEDATFQDHWQISSGLLERKYTRETTLYRCRWRGFREAEDTFQPEHTLRGDPVFEVYVTQQNFRDPSRCFMPTDRTMERVRYNLRQGFRAVENFGPLKEAANDINVRYPGGQRANKALQDSYQSSQARDLFNNTWRLVYMLLHAGILRLIAANSNLAPFVIFEQAVFYIGKGTAERPFEHLEEARDYLLNPNSQQKQLTDCALRVADIWRDGHGVVVLPVVIKLCDADVKGREAALISLKKIGLWNLANTAKGSFPPLDNVSREDWAELGVMELIKAFKLYEKTEAKCCYLWDIPRTIDEIDAWYGVCPTPYRSRVSTPCTPIASAELRASDALKITRWPKHEEVDFMRVLRVYGIKDNTSIADVINWTRFRELSTCLQKKTDDEMLEELYCTLAMCTKQRGHELSKVDQRRADRVEVISAQKAEKLMNRLHLMRTIHAIITTGIHHVRTSLKRCSTEHMPSGWTELHDEQLIIIIDKWGLDCIAPHIAQVRAFEKIVTPEEKILIRRAVEICNTLETGRWNGIASTEMIEDEETSLTDTMLPQSTEILQKAVDAAAAAAASVLSMNNAAAGLELAEILEKMRALTHQSLLQNTEDAAAATSQNYASAMPPLMGLAPGSSSSSSAQHQHLQQLQALLALSALSGRTPETSIASLASVMQAMTGLDLAPLAQHSAPGSTGSATLTSTSTSMQATTSSTTRKPGQQAKGPGN